MFQQSLPPANLIIVPEALFKELVEKITFLTESVNQLKSTSHWDWIDNKEACKLLGVSARSLQSWRDHGLIDHSKIGAKIFYKMESIEKMLNQNKI